MNTNLSVMRPAFLQRKHAELSGKSSIVLGLWRVEVDRTDFNGDFKHKAYRRDQRLSSDVPSYRTFSQTTYSPYMPGLTDTSQF